MGKRHFESTLTLKKLDVYVVDNSKEAVNLVNDIPNPNQNRVTTLDDIEALPTQIDLAIIATNSLPRKQIIDKLLGHSKVGHLVLEKLLFPRLQEYDQSVSLLESSSIETWINCPFRMYPLFKDIKSKIKIENSISLSITGNNWGLATTAIHLLDLLCFLREDPNLELSSLLDEEVFESKRKGYYEVNGGILATNTYGDKLYINSKNVEGKSPKYFVIQDEFQRWSFQDNMTEGRYCNSDVKWREEVFEFNFPYQSGLTSIFVQDLLSKGTCDLPRFSETYTLHKDYLQFLNTHFEKQWKKKIEICPIT